MQYTENFSLRKAQYSDPADVADLNYNFDEIDDILLYNRLISAESYDATETYNTGDLAVYENVLYKCLEDNVTGVWDSTKWVATNLASEIGGGEASALEDLTDVDVDSPADGEVLTWDGEKWVNAEGSATVTKTAEGNPLTFSDGADAPLVKCVTEIQGSQDLHGYDKPWVGGAGKNKCSNDTTLHLNVTASIGSTGTFGTNTSYDVYYFKTSDYANIAVSCDKTKLNSKTIRVCYSDTIPANGTTYMRANNLAPGNYVTVDNTYTYIIFVFFWNDISDKSLIQIENGTVCTSYEPYSNICPISGFSEVNIDGCGKNLIQMTLESLKSYNTVGTWSGNSYQRNGVTFDVQTDANNNVIGIKATGTASTSSTFVIVDNIVNPFGGMVLNGCPVSGSASAYEIRFIYKDQNDGWLGQAYDFGDGVTIENGYPHCSIVIDVLSGYAIPTGGLVFRPMVRLASDADATFKPYTPNNYIIDLDGTRYGGELDVCRGVLMVTHGYVDLGDLTWAKGSTNRFYAALNDIKEPSSASAVGDIKSSQYVAQSANATYSGVDGISAGNNAVYVYDSTKASMTASDFTTAMNGVECVYELATPIEIPLSPTSIRTLSGYNHIESSTGDMEVEYITQDYQPLVDLIEDSKAESVHTYSTDEQIVGTWIDGSTLYEKTFTKSSVTSVGSIDTGISFGMAMIKDGYYLLNDGNSMLALNEYLDTGMFSRTHIELDGSIDYRLAGYTGDLTVTILYTKASAQTRSLSSGSLNLSKGEISGEKKKAEEEPIEEEKTAENDLDEWLEDSEEIEEEVDEGTDEDSDVEEEEENED